MSSVADLRKYLDANNGLHGLEIFDPLDVDDIVRVFRRDGFVVVRDILTDEQVETLRAGCDEVVDEILALDPKREGNRGVRRYSFGASSTTGSQLHRSEWQMLVDLPTLTPIISAIFGSADYLLRAAGGDFCVPGAVDYQALHSDMGHGTFHDPRGQLTYRDLPCPFLCANFLTIDATATNGATRQIPGTQHSREPIPTLAQEPEWMRLSTVCPAPAGSVQLRDVRAWHGGTPNVSDDVRSIPNIELYAPWFHFPVTPSISPTDYRKLSEHGRRIARLCVPDSSEELVAKTVFSP